MLGKFVRRDVLALRARFQFKLELRKKFHERLLTGRYSPEVAHREKVQTGLLRDVNASRLRSELEIIVRAKRLNAPPSEILFNGIIDHGLEY